jgi:hypothetical protein
MYVKEFIYNFKNLIFLCSNTKKYKKKKNYFMKIKMFFFPIDLKQIL